MQLVCKEKVKIMYTSAKNNYCHISSNRCHPRIVAAQSKALEHNKCRPRIAAAASKHSMCTRVRMISDDCHHTSTRTVRVVQVIPTADSRTERLCVLLTVSSSHQRLATVTVSLIHTLFSRRRCLRAFQRNKHNPRIVATQNKQRNK